MKTIKIILATILLTGFLFSSCSNDSEETSDDQIVGNWKLVQIYYQNVSEDIPECEKESSFQFTAEGTYTQTVYHCLSSGSTPTVGTVLGTWEHNNSTYIFTQSSNGSQEEATITFDNQNMTIFPLATPDYKSVWLKF